MNYSSIGKRLAAYLIDFLVCVAICGVSLVTYYGVFAVAPIGVVLYFVLCEGSEWHATLGKKAMNMQVVDANGIGIDYGKSLLRCVCKGVSSLTLGIGYLIAFSSNEYQTLHDKMAGTYVVDTVPSLSSGGSSMRAVVGVRGEAAGMRFPIVGNGILIGRDSAACQLVLKRSNGVSRLHCLISYNPQSNMFILTDRNSRYGTFTQNGVRVTPNKSVALKSGERFYLGSPDNMFEVK